jgi:ABC-type sugar transport systems, permease components
VAKPGVFVGLDNFIADWHNPVFWQVVVNTFVYTTAATLLKMVGGLGLALVMNQDFRFKNLTRRCCCCRSSCRPCCRPSPGSGSSTPPSA